MAWPLRTLPAARHVHDELHDAGDFLGRSADATESSRTLQRAASWIHIAFLFFVTSMPFSTALLAKFTAYRIALVAYWLNILCLGSALYVSWGCATRSGLVKDDIAPEVPAAVCRRIVIAQALCAFGALLCIVSTYWSIAFIVLVQFYYALAPRLPWESSSAM